MNIAKAVVKSVANRLGFEIKRHSRTMPNLESAMQKKRNLLLKAEEIAVVLDVGGNRGAYGQLMRNAGYSGRIVSFEPLKEAYRMLMQASASDKTWDCYPYALGEQSEIAELHVAGNLDSSSFLPMGEIHLHAAPETAYRNTETVEVKRLDEIANSLSVLGEHIWLKLDVQGYELHVLHGAEALLAHVQVIETELSYVSLYDGQPLLSDVFDYLNKHGFNLVLTEDTLADWKTGHVLQVDALFVRRVH